MGRDSALHFVNPPAPPLGYRPVYPYLLAGIFRLFGTFSVASYWVAIAFNILVHALTCVVLYWAATDAFGPAVGWFSGCALGAFPLLFYPLVLAHVLGGYMGQGLFISPNLIWYTQLSELAVISLIWLTLRKPHWVIYGLSWGIASLVNPDILSCAPAFLAWRIWRGDKARWAMLAGLVATCCIAPWLMRNYMVFHHFIFIRDDFGVELKVGNQPRQDGQWDPRVHPDANIYELSRVETMGENAYTQAAEKDAFSAILSHPKEFARNVMLRVGYWWIGNPMASTRLRKLRFLKYLPLAAFSLLTLYGAARNLRYRNYKAIPFVAVLIFYPIVYYLTHTFSGFFYQYAVHPEMLALAASAILRDKPHQQREMTRNLDLERMGESLLQPVASLQPQPH